MRKKPAVKTTDASEAQQVLERDRKLREQECAKEVSAACEKWKCILVPHWEKYGTQEKADVQIVAQ